MFNKIKNWFKSLKSPEPHAFLQEEQQHDIDKVFPHKAKLYRRGRDEARNLIMKLHTKGHSVSYITKLMGYKSHSHVSKTIKKFS